MNWIEKNNGKFDYILVLVPTTPLRDSKELDKCIEYFLKMKKAKAVFSVCECGHHPLQANKLPKDLSMKKFVKKIQMDEQTRTPNILSTFWINMHF